MLVIAHAVPPAQRFGLAADLGARRRHAGFAARKPQVHPRARRGTRTLKGVGRRMRLRSSQARAAIEAISSATAASRRGAGVTRIETSRITPSDPSAPACRRKRSKPATFLNTCPPKRSTCPRPSSKRHAQNAVAHRTGEWSPRTRESGGNHAADRARFAEARRLEREPLAMLGEPRPDLGERRAGARGHHQFGRLVVDDAERGPRRAAARHRRAARRSPSCRRPRRAAGAAQPRPHAPVRQAPRSGRRLRGS